MAFVSDDDAWEAFDTMTSMAISMPAVVSGFDEIISDIIIEKSEEIKNLIRAEFESKGWIKIKK